MTCTPVLTKNNLKFFVQYTLRNACWCLLYIWFAFLCISLNHSNFFHCVSSTDLDIFLCVRKRSNFHFFPKQISCYPSCSEQWLCSGCGGFSCGRAWALGHGGVSGCSSQAPEHKFSSCGIFPDQGSNPRLLPWQVDSSPLSHQGSPIKTLHYIYSCFLYWMHSLDLV